MNPLRSSKPSSLSLALHQLEDIADPAGALHVPDQASLVGLLAADEQHLYLGDTASGAGLAEQLGHSCLHGFTLHWLAGYYQLILYSSNISMGNTPETIRIHGFKKNSNLLLNIKLPKLRDYFAAFKSICDNFSIDLTEFEHIFGTGESAFVIWDTDNNGLVDSLELFAGIAIFADIKLEDKMRFLFDMFDFNEIDVLEPIQVEFMVYCACSASFKIFSITNEIRNEEIEEFVKDLFFDYTKITVADLIKKSKESKKIQEFFEAIKFDKTKNQPPEKISESKYKQQPEVQKQ